MSVLSIKGLRSGYGDIAVINGVDIELADNEFLGVFGHNGMGKSTLMKTIAGVVPTTAGHIHLAGADITSRTVAKRARAGLGYVPQGRQVYPNLTGEENLKVAQLGAGRDGAGIEAVVSMLPRIGPLLKRMGGVMSGGEQQILALGRCLIAAPRVILLDEPTEGIQPSIREEMIETLKHIRSQTTISIVLVEQNIEFLKSLSDRIVVLQKGSVVSEVADVSSADLESIDL
ncbi:ABC transporter ATP-binding protein [Mesorhizobium sp. B2-4-9]|uniref:ABC transporter ATP-binding protein n=1 Tax=Mesorhizobium sp. B2-4-9 TaxID=2589940 RepID=UPI0032B2786B